MQEWKRNFGGRVVTIDAPIGATDMQDIQLLNEHVFPNGFPTALQAAILILQLQSTMQEDCEVCSKCALSFLSTHLNLHTRARFSFPSQKRGPLRLPWLRARRQWSACATTSCPPPCLFRARSRPGGTSFWARTTWKSF